MTEKTNLARMQSQTRRRVSRTTGCDERCAGFDERCVMGHVNTKSEDRNGRYKVDHARKWRERIATLMSMTYNKESIVTNALG